MKWFMNLTLAKKLALLLSLSGLIPMALVAVMAYRTAEQDLQQQAFNQLQSIRDIKASAIERYFASVDQQVLSMARDPFIVEAMQVLTPAFAQARSGSLTPLSEMRRSLAEYYNQDFASQYREKNSSSPNVSAMLDGLDEQAVVMQYHYISNNSNPLGNKHLLDSAAATSGLEYHPLHAKYHPFVRDFLERFGYYDIFLIDSVTGDIVYSVFKELDYATSLYDGPYANTNFASAFQAANTLAQGETILVDYQPYLPSYEAPASFIATPIFSSQGREGVLIFQMPLEPVNAIMTQRTGMGETGETYLVGSDLLMRSDSYLDPTNHSVSGSFSNPEKGKVDTAATKAALAGTTGKEIVLDYNGNPVLSAYAPIKFGTFQWSILAEIDEAEAFASIYGLKNTMLLAGAIVLGLIVVAALLIAKQLALPILNLGRVIQDVQRTGNFDINLDNPYSDEVGETSRAFSALLNDVSNNFREVTNVLSGINEGDFSRSVGGDYVGELATLKSGINNTVSQLAESTIAQKRAAEEAERSAEKAQSIAAEAQTQATEALRIKQALDVSNTSIMITDNEFNIIYLNESSGKLMGGLEPQIKQSLPRFDASSLIGTNIDVFHQNPRHNREVLRGLTQSHTSRIEISGLTLQISATAIRNENNEFSGAVVEWQDLTAQLAAQEEERIKSEENERVKQALDCVSTNTMIADANNEIIYLNHAIVDMMKNAESDLRTALPNFDAGKLMGQSMDNFHRDPNHQRSLINSLKGTHQSEVSVGGRTFSLTANPILNEGQRIGTVVEWLDRTDEVEIEREVDKVIAAAGTGDFNHRIDAQGKEGFFKTLSDGINSLVSTTQAGLDDVIRVLSAMASGDLTQRIEKDYQGSFAQLKQDTNQTCDTLAEVVEKIKLSADTVLNGAEEIAKGNTDLSQRTEEQASSLEETASSMQEMTESVQQNSENAEHANSIAREAQDRARQGGEVVSNAVVSMEEINTSSKKVVDIIGVIDEIAFQTNLLALNAAVEAARAGEQGRGFSVVAGEVRNLAQRSADAAKEIKTLIEESVDKVSAGTKLVNESGDTLSNIVESVEKASQMIQQIANATQEQTSGILQVNTAVTQMDEMTQQNAALVEEATAAGENMAEQARAMTSAVGFFRTR
ncbi:hypothetical protein NBRC116494_09160 [Aurantivibrio plasticivorans]